MHPQPLLLTALLPLTLAAGIYPKGSPVLNVDGRSFRDVIELSNHTSLVEFYAPWCGHCKNLQPAYEKAAKSLAGLAKVAAVNCDAEENKPFCGRMGVQGFPTLKIVRPGKRPGRPLVEDYQGARTAKGMVDAVISQIPNHVKRLKDDNYEAWLEGEEPKAILFSDKGTTSALLKALAVDFLGAIAVAQIRATEKEAVSVFQIDKFPALVLLPGDGKEPVHYNGDMKKEPMRAFLSQAAPPNPDPAPQEKKKPKSSSSKNTKAKASSSKSSQFAKASASHASADSQSQNAPPASQTAETVVDEAPTASPNPNVVDKDTPKPIAVPDLAPPISSLNDARDLAQTCLNTKSGPCLLALLTPTPGMSTIRAIAGLSEIAHKHGKALFPFYQVPHTNAGAAALRSKLNLNDGEVEVLVVNGKRGWYRHYSSPSFAQQDLETWIDAVRMGDIPKENLPEGLVVELPAEAEAEPAEIPLGGGGGGTDQMEAMREALKGQLPEGVEFEMDEVDEEEYQRILAAQHRDAEDAEAAPEGEHEHAHDEL